MRFKKLDLNLLVALDALLREQSISRAAERLYMSQSAMSNALSRLREYFGDELLMQVGRRMEMTPRALALKDSVRDVLLRVDTTIAIHPEFDPRESDREFRLFVSDYSLNVLIPHLMALTAEQGATVRFQFLPQVDQPQRSLDLGEVDLLIIPSSYCTPEHPSEVLFKEEFCCLVWAGSAHAKAGAMGFEAYTAAGHVVMQPPGGQPSFEAWFMQRYGVSRRVEVTTYNFSTTPWLVLNTERVATVHRRLAALAARTAPLAMLDPPVPMPAMEQALQWPRYRSQDPGLEWLRRSLAEAARRMDAAGDSR